MWLGVVGNNLPAQISTQRCSVSTTQLFSSCSLVVVVVGDRSKNIYVFALRTSSVRGGEWGHKDIRAVSTLCTPHRGPRD